MPAPVINDRNGFTIITQGKARVEVWAGQERWSGWADPYVSMSSQRLEDADELADLQACLKEAAKVLARYVAAAATERAEALERQRKEREAAEQARQERLRELEAARERQRQIEEKRNAEMEGRKETLMHEFVDEPVRARARGYKQAVRAVVRVREIKVWREGDYVGTGEYQPYIEYVYDNDYNRPNRVESIMRLEIKDGSRYKVLWDDGREDLGYDKGADAETEHKMKEYDEDMKEQWS